MKHLPLISLLMPVLAFASEIYEADISGAAKITNEKSGLVFYTARVKLPAEGKWIVAQDKTAFTKSPVRSVFIFPDNPDDLDRYRLESADGRAAAVFREKESAKGAKPLHWIHTCLRKYALENSGALPPDFNSIKDKPYAQDYLKDIFESPYSSARRNDGMSWGIVPGSRMIFNDPGEWPTNTDTVVVELRPLYNDGRHWILRADGSTGRVPVSGEFMSECGFEIKPLRMTDELQMQIEYTVCGIANPDFKRKNAEMNIVLKNTDSGSEARIKWTDIKNENDQAAEPDETLKKWAEERMRRLFRGIPPECVHCSGILKYWISAQERLFETSASDLPESLALRMTDHTRSESVFGVLGGQSAINETLQMFVLDAAADKRSANEPRVGINEIEGVAVSSHPFGEMLAGSAGGSLPLADIVPHDCFFLYAAKPEKLLMLLDGGSEFIAKSGAAAVGSSMDYSIEERYLDYFGFDRKWLTAFLNSKIITEAAVVLPDLFLIDGTDMTAVCRISDKKKLAGTLKRIGVKIKEEGAVVNVKTPSGKTVSWAISGDLLIIGASGSPEIDKILRLAGHPADREDLSLGRSDEFRYMLTRLPLQPDTGLYAYFSDPFIRRLTGPEVKIGQLRRLEAKTKITAVIAAVMLWKLDGHKDIPGIQTLVEKGYLSPGVDYADIFISGDGTVTSEKYGRLSELLPLSRFPVTDVTKNEADAYNAYRDNYSRYWRRYFDPVAMRFDDDGDGCFNLETFILPLLDNTLYDQLKTALSPDGGPGTFSIPVISNKPPLMISVNIPDRSWKKTMFDLLRRKDDCSPEFSRVINDLGPGIHFIVHDSAPVLAIGTGDMFGLGSEIIGGDFDLTTGIFLFVSAFTRPCTLMLELSDGKAARRLLESGDISFLPFLGADDVAVESYALAGSDAWIYKLQMLSLTVRLKVELKNGYILIHNIPWGPDVGIASAGESADKAVEVNINPDKAVIQSESLYMASEEENRNISGHGIAMLAPFMISGDETSDEALKHHKDIFGFVPRHPCGSKWTANPDGTLRSEIYGNAVSPVQNPPSAENAGVGIFSGITDLEIGMKFEDAGLRSDIRWKYSPDKSGRKAK